MSDGKLYATEVPDDAILHGGDMRLFDVIADTTTAYESTDHPDKDCWNSVVTVDSIVEMVGASASVYRYGKRRSRFLQPARLTTNPARAIAACRCVQRLL